MTSPTSPGKSLAAFMQQSRKVFGVAVIEGFEIAWSRSAGTAPGCLFQAGSISKPVTALAALELAAQGEIDLDSDVNDRLSSWRVPGSDQVTVRHLLGHTSGMGVPFFPGYAQAADAPTLSQVLDGIPPSVTPAVRVDPGRYSRFCYSGGGYAIIQQLIADVTGMPFAAAARALVLEPLGMTRSTFEQPLPTGLHPLAVRQDWHVYPESAAAGLWTTPDDLALFTGALQAALAGGSSAIRAETAALMLAPHAPLPGGGEWSALPLLGIRSPDSYGLGMFLYGKARFGHFGGAASFFSALIGSMVNGSGVVVMMASNASPFLFKLLRMISDELGWTGFRQPGWKRWQGLRGVRYLA